MVAELLEEQLDTKVHARRYAPGGYNWEQHLADTADPSRLLHSLLGPGGNKSWDYVIFQVSVLPKSRIPSVVTRSHHWHLCSGVAAIIRIFDR